MDENNNKIIEQKRLYTIKEAATLLRVDPMTVRRWWKDGKISVIRILGNKPRITKEEMDRLLGYDSANKSDWQNVILTKQTKEGYNNHMNTKNTKLYGQKEVADILGVTLTTVRRWVEAGKVNVVYLPTSRRPFITEEELDRLRTPMKEKPYWKI